jgi:hypothetical protein
MVRFHCFVAKFLPFFDLITFLQILDTHRQHAALYLCQMILFNQPQHSFYCHTLHSMHYIYDLILVFQYYPLSRHIYKARLFVKVVAIND